MSEVTLLLKGYLPDNFEEIVTDSDYGEETAAKNYVVPILQELGLDHADYEEIIESGDRPDFIWRDADGIDRIVGELKKPWDEDNSPSEPKYKLRQGIEEAEIYNDQLRLKYILVSDGRYIYLSNEYGDPPEQVELDLLELYQDPTSDDVERVTSQLKSWITDLYNGEWNETPSERDISNEDIFDEFISASKKALNEDILPSIERRFDSYESRWDEFQTERERIEDQKEELRQKYRGYIGWEKYQEAIDAVAGDLNFDYERHLSGSSSGVDEERWIDEVANFREEILALNSQIIELERRYRHAIDWHQKWNRWLNLTGKDYKGTSKKEQEKIRETFQLQTLNVLYNRLLLIRTFEDMGIIGQVISNGFMRFFDEKVQLRENQYIEPLTTATRQAKEVYSPLFHRNTPHDWYHWEEPVLRTVLRRFDNFNFRNIDRDIFGAMYQRCLDSEKRKRLGAYYTPPKVIRFLLDYSGFASKENNIKQPSERVLDPACGSGTFVLESMDRVLSALDDSGYDFTRDDDLLDAIEVVNKKLYGFDIDPFAVQLAQSNLLIRILQERRKKKDVDTHLEFPSFSIFETDSLLTAKESLSGNKDRFYRARENDAENLNRIVDAKEEDYLWVIGNPPYVRTHNQNPKVTAEYELLHETFGDEQSDIFLAFVEQALEWLDDGGRLAFVISNKLLVTDASEDAMEFMLDNATIDFIGDLTRCKIFGFDVNVFPILVVLTKRSGDEYEAERKENKTQVAKIYPKGSKATNEWGYALDYAASELIEWRNDPIDFDFEDDFESNEYPHVSNEDTFDIYEVSQERFTEGWSDWAESLKLNFQINDKLWEVVTQMENNDNSVPLKNICPTIDDGGGRGGAPSRGEEPRYYREYLTDEDNGVPVITGSNLGQFYLGDQEPDVKEYVDIDAMQADLEDDDVDTNISESKLNVFLNDTRIAYRAAAPELTFAVDDPSDQVRYYNKRAYFIMLSSGSNNTLGQFTPKHTIDDPHYICGLLNSELLDFYYKSYYEHLSFRHAPAIECRTGHMTHLPIYIPNKEEEEAISNLSKTLHENKREHKQVNHRLETLFDLYKDRGDTVSFRTKVSSIIDSRKNYNINSFSISRDGTAIELNRYYTVEMHTEAEAKKLASFLEDFGDKYIGGDKLRNLELPSDLDEFRRDYERLKELSEELNSDIEADMAALNDKVYDLYGVEEYRDDIQEYLDSFLTVIQ